MKKRFLLTIISLAILSIATILYLHLNGRGVLVFGCAIYNATGYACPTCNFTDMLQSLLRLDFSHAFSSNPYMFITLPVWFYIIFKFLVHYIKTGKFLNDKKINIVLILLIIIGILFGIARNF